MNKSTMILWAVLPVLLISLSFTKTKPMPSNDHPIYEIAVRQVKDGQKDAFEEAREQFIDALTAQEGVSNDREFKSFYAMPSPDEREVFIGMTEYASLETLGAIQQHATVEEKFGAFAQTMDLKAYVFVQPIEGGTFDLGQLATKPGQVLEIAIRRVKGDLDAFHTARKQFVAKLDATDGVVASWEFAVVAGQDTDNLTVGMTVYESQEKFMAISEQAQSWPEAAFFGMIEPVAIQYATVVK